MLSLETPRMTVKIEARGDGSCRLVGPDRPELKPLMTTSTTAGRLIAELSKCGIHLAPDALDEEAVASRGGNWAAKDESVEQKLCEELGRHWRRVLTWPTTRRPRVYLLVGVRCDCARRRCTSPRHLDRRRRWTMIPYLLKETTPRNPSRTPWTAGPYQLRLSSANSSRAAPASGNPETDRPFDDSLAPGAESHVFLARAARPVASDEAARWRGRRFKFQQAVGGAHLTRPFSFSASLWWGRVIHVYTRGFQFHHFPKAAGSGNAGARRSAISRGVFARRRFMSRRGRARRGTGGGQF